MAKSALKPKTPKLEVVSDATKAGRVARGNYTKTVLPARARAGSKRVFITKKKAEEFLRTNAINNRPWDMDTSIEYAEMMERGEWSPFIGVILFFILPNGTHMLIDGQHRLNAVLLLPDSIDGVWFNVDYTDDPDDMKRIDQNKPRSAQDIVRMRTEDKDIRKYAVKLRSATARRLQYDGKTFNQSRSDISKPEMADLILRQAYPRLIDSVRRVSPQFGKRYASPDTLMALHSLSVAIDPELTDRLFKALEFPNLGDRENTMTTLAEKLAGLKTSSTKLVGTELHKSITWHYAMAWNLLRAGHTRRRILGATYKRGDEIPSMDGADRI